MRSGAQANCSGLGWSGLRWGYSATRSSPSGAGRGAGSVAALGKLPGGGAVGACSAERIPSMRASASGSDTARGSAATIPMLPSW